MNECVCDISHEKKVYNFVKPVDKVTAHRVAVDPRGEEEGLPKF